jgi:hypothetical protein
MVDSFAHRAAWWFYLAWLPLMLAPWLLWPRWWRSLRGTLGRESGVRLVVLVMLFALLAFSLISGKRWHYLLPEFPLFALFIARALCDSRSGRPWVPAVSLAVLGAAGVAGAPRLASSLGGLDDAQALAWGGAVAIGVALLLLARRAGPALADVRAVATAALIATSALAVAAEFALREPYDIDAVAAQLARHEREGRPLAIEGDYNGQWHLAGRLRKPLVEVPTAQVAGWLATHPEGRLVFMYRKPEEIPAGTRIDFEQRRYRGQHLAILAPG